MWLTNPIFSDSSAIEQVPAAEGVQKVPGGVVLDKGRAERVLQERHAAIKTYRYLRLGNIGGVPAAYFLAAVFVN